MSARSCRDVRVDLSAYLDDDLDAVQAGETRLHLERCAGCRAELELLRLSIGALHRLPDLPPPAAILAGVRAHLRPEPWYRRLLGGRQWSLGVPVGALATLLVVVGISLFQSRYPDMSKTVSQVPSPQRTTPPAPEMKSQPRSIAPPSPSARDWSPARQAAAPIAPAVPAELTARESKLEKSRQTQPEPPVTALKETFRDDSQRGENIAAAPSPRAIPKSEPVLGGRAEIDELAREAEKSSLPSDKKKESSVEIIYLLDPDGGNVHNLETLLRREGAVDIVVSALEPQAIRGVFAPHRERLSALPEPTRGWTVTARVSPSAFDRLLRALSSRPGLRILEQPTHLAPEYTTEPLSLRITVLR